MRLWILEFSANYIGKNFPKYYLLLFVDKHGCNFKSTGKREADSIFAVCTGVSLFHRTVKILPRPR